MRIARSVVAVVLASTGLVARPAAAQTSAELAAGRALFAEALADEENARYVDALAKYRRVQGVRDTPAVRFRIGAALEGAGRLVEAVDAYDRAALLASETPATRDVETAARERARAVRASIDPVPAGRGDTPAAGEPAVTRIAITGSPSPSPSPAPPAGSLRPAVAIGATVTGAMLVVGGAVFLGLRASNVADLEAACPAGACPRSRAGELESTRDRALTQGPIGVALVAVGAAAVTTGIVLFATSPGHGPGASVGATARAGGGTLTLTGAF